jgi:type IV pilus assembly protein PilM
LKAESILSIATKLRRLFEDPPPEFVFELSEAGISWTRRGKTLRTGFEPLAPGVLSVSPVRDNILMPDELAAAIRRLAPQTAQKKRRAAGLILPDYCGRVAVLDFDTFPSEPKEQQSLVRFRVKKSVPFDLEAASVSFHVQPHPSGGKRRDVVVAVVSIEILARYEAPLRATGLHPGFVTLSALSALSLLQADRLDVMAKLSGKVLSVAVIETGALRMYRCVELEQVRPDDLMDVLFPTFAYVEDEMKRRPDRLLLCGFGAFGDQAASDFHAELGTPVEPVRSLYGPPGPHNAGMLGYLQSLGLDLGAAA